MSGPVAARSQTVALPQQASSHQLKGHSGRQSLTGSQPARAYRARLLAWAGGSLVGLQEQHGDVPLTSQR
jgi:hypothetical protein